MNLFVVDTSTIVSASLKPAGIPKQALTRAQLVGSIAMSRVVFAEIVEVLGRPKFARSISDPTRQEILEGLETGAIWFEPTTRITDCRDPKDNIYLELALEAQATAIITGDADLLVLHPWRAIPVLNSADFLLRHP